MENKKRWVQPELIVLARGRPEEGVLDFCKYSFGDSGPVDLHSNCNGEAEFCYYCDENQAS